MTTYTVGTIALPAGYALSKVDGAAVTFPHVTGSLTIAANGALSYDDGGVTSGHPLGGEVRQVASFTVTASDGTKETAPATITVSLEGDALSVSGAQTLSLPSGGGTYDAAAQFTTTGAPDTTIYSVADDPSGEASVDAGTGLVSITGSGYSAAVAIRRSDTTAGFTEVADLVLNVDVAAEAVAYDGGFPEIYAIEGGPAVSYDLAQHFTPSGVAISSTTLGAGWSITDGVLTGYPVAGLDAPQHGTDWTSGEDPAQYLTATLLAGYTVPAGHEVAVDPTQDQNSPFGTGALLSPGQTWTANYPKEIGSTWYLRMLLRSVSTGAIVASNVSPAITIAGDASPEPVPGGSLSVASTFENDVEDVNLGRRGKVYQTVMDLPALTGTTTTGQDRTYPAGISDDGQTVTIDTDVLSGTVTGKTFINRRVTVTGNGPFTARECIFGIDAGHNDVHRSGHRHYCKVSHGVGLVDIQQCDFLGTGTWAGENSCFSRDASSTDGTATVSGGTIFRRNRLYGMTQDAIKPAMHPDTIIEENWIYYTTINYAAGEDPHADAMNPAVGKGGTIRRNLVDMRVDSDKFNNCIRAMTNTGHTVPFGGFRIEDNILLKHPNQAGKPLQIGPKDTPNYEPIIAVGNRITPSSGGAYIHETANDTMIWMHNIDHWTNREIPASEIDAALTSGAAVESVEAVYTHNTALRALSGVAGAGEVIEARAVSQGDGGVKTTSWKPIATADASGNWSGELPVPGSNVAYKAQVREQSNPTGALTVPGQFRTGVGSVIWSQSNGAHAFYPKPAPSRPTPEPITNPNALWVGYADRERAATAPHAASVFQYRRVHDGEGLIAPYARLSNRWTETGLDMTLKLIPACVSGTSLQDDVSELSRQKNGAYVGRWWADEIAQHQAAGARPGITFQFMEGGTTHAQCWPNVYGSAWFGVDENGDPFAAGDYSGTTLDHTKAEIYGDQSERMVNVFIKPYGSGTDFEVTGRERLLQMVDHPVYDKFLAPHVQPHFPSLTTVKGENGGTTDTTHVAQDTEFGFIAQAELLFGYMMVHTGSLGNKVGACLNYVRPSPNGDNTYVAVGWTEGLVTTYFRRAGKTRLTGGKYDRADVIYFDGYRAEIRDPDTGLLADQGEIWVQKTDGTAWTDAQIRAIPLPELGRRDTSAAGDLSSGWTTAHHPCVAIRGIICPIQFDPEPGPNPTPADLFSAYDTYAPGWNEVR